MLGTSVNHLHASSLTLLLAAHLHVLIAEAQVRDEATENGGEANGSKDARDGRQREHETDHDAREVPGDGTVDDEEDDAIAHLLEEEVYAHRRQRDDDLEVQEEGGPGGGLMLTHRCNDGNVLGGVGRVEQGQRAPGPAGDAMREDGKKGGPQDLDEDEKNDDDDDEGEDEHEEMAVVFGGKRAIGEDEEGIACDERMM